MDSYVVRVYRRGLSDPNEVAGLVESVGSDERRVFQSFSGLVKAIRQALGEDEEGVGMETQAHVYEQGVSMLKKRQVG
jgi:hypothetical protein